MSAILNDTGGKGGLRWNHALAVLVLAINLLGDWLRDALNPKLR